METLSVNTALKPRLGFVGTGWIGLNRMKALLEASVCTPVGVSDTSPQNVRMALEMAPQSKAYDTFEKLLESKPDGIVIATPSALHASQCIDALNRGIAVFCQKPLARSAAESKAIIDVAEKNNILLGVDLSYRFTEGMQIIHELVSNHDLGKIFAVDLEFHNAYGPDKDWFYNPQLSGGGCLIDLGIHLADLAMWILEFPEIKRLQSSLFHKGHPVVDTDKVSEDFAMVQFETTDGKAIRLTCSWNLSAGKDAEIRAAFYGTGASAILSNVNGSFYGFESKLYHGTTSTTLSSPPDEWGGRALIEWTEKLAARIGFDPKIRNYEKVAHIIDMAYGREHLEGDER